jgi:hypothetical protein
MVSHENGIRIGPKGRHANSRARLAQTLLARSARASSAEAGPLPIGLGFR